MSNMHNDRQVLGVRMVDATGAPIAATPGGGTPVVGGSGVVANASAVATLAAAAAKTTYISGLLIAGGGATVAALVDVTIAGLLGGTKTFVHGAVVGATLKNADVAMYFDPPLPAADVNTAIVVTCPALGAGNAKNSVTAWGFQL